MYKHLLLTLVTALLIILPGASAQAVDKIQSRGLTSDTCTNIGILFKKVAESDKSLNLSTVFMNSTVYETTYTTSWSGSMTCTYGNVGIGSAFQDRLYYFTGFDSNPVYLNFNSSDGEHSYWIKVTSEITGVTKVTVSGVIGIHSLGYQTQYKLRAELLSAAPTGVADYTKTTTSGALSVVPAVMSGAGAGTDKTGLTGWFGTTYAALAQSYMMNDTAQKGWDTSYFLAFEKLTIQFEPNETTCNMTHDLSVKLPPAPLKTLKANGQANGADFTIPFVCGNLAGVTKATRPISAWISSNDLVSTDSSYQIMVNDESTAGGVGIALRSRYFLGQAEEVQISGSNDMEHASQILDIEKDDDIQGTQSIRLHAYYKVYDSSALTTGTVVATAQIMFGYD